MAWLLLGRILTRGILVILALFVAMIAGIIWQARWFFGPRRSPARLLLLGRAPKPTIVDTERLEYPVVGARYTATPPASNLPSPQSCSPIRCVGSVNTTSGW
jgi:hypothetical protein